MQIKKLAAACAVAFATAPAFALSAFDTPDMTVFLSGASAPDNFLQDIATGMFVGTKGTDWFAYVDNDLHTHSRAFFGTMKGTADGVPSTLAGKKVLFIKRSSGGSVFGVNPVARGEKLATLKVDSSVCTASTVSGYEYECPVVGVDPGLGAFQTGEERQPDFGVSDVSPAMFKQPLNVEYGADQLSPAEVTNLTIKGVNVIAMGLAVTNTIPDTTYFSKAAYGAMLSANLYDWTQIDPSLSPAAGTQVVVCRRVQGSGTQTSYNWFFNNFPCSTNSIAGTGNTFPARMADSASGVDTGDHDGIPGNEGSSADPYVVDVTAGPTFLEHASSSDVAKCMDKASGGGVHTFKDEQGKYVKVDFGTGGYGAIAVLSVDSLGKSSNAAGKWSFRAIDGAGMYYDSDAGSAVVPASTGTGVHPSKDNLIDGKYEFASEITMQYLTGLETAKKDFANFFIARAGSPAFNSSAWVAALPPTYDPTTTANVAKGTRFGNMCSPLQRLF